METKEVVLIDLVPDTVPTMQDTFVEQQAASELVERVLLLVQVESYLEDCSEPEVVQSLNDSHQEQVLEDSQKYQSPTEPQPSSPLESVHESLLQDSLLHQKPKDSSLSTLPPQQPDVEARSREETLPPPTDPSQTTQPSFTKDDTSLNIKPKKKGRSKK
jgi:hypothetical protein